MSIKTDTGRDQFQTDCTTYNVQRNALRWQQVSFSVIKHPKAISENPVKSCGSSTMYQGGKQPVHVTPYYTVQTRTGLPLLYITQLTKPILTWMKCGPVSTLTQCSSSTTPRNQLAVAVWMGEAVKMLHTHIEEQSSLVSLPCRNACSFTKPILLSLFIYWGQSWSIFSGIHM